MNSFIYLLRREIWEHRAFVMVPLVIAALYTFGHIIGLAQFARFSVDGHTFHDFGDFIEDLTWLDPGERRDAMGFMMSVTAMPFFVALGFMTFFYLLDALFADRKDRSILFWKSLPISDTATVMSKVAVATLVAPLITIGWVFAMHISTLMALTVLVWSGDGSAWELVWSPMPFIEVYALYAYMVIAGAVWYAPVWGWLLLASAWARKAVFLWATLPIVVLGVFEQIFLDSENFWRMIAYRVGYGFWMNAFAEESELIGVNVGNDRVDVSGSVLDLARPDLLFSNLDTYLGVVVAAGFVAGAIWLRRYRDET